MFQFKQFSIDDTHCAMKIGTDGVILGAWAFDRFSPTRILDVGSGSGLLSLMMAQRFTKAQISGIEIDTDAYLDALFNVSNSKWSGHIEILNGDFLSYNLSGTFDAIITNPPFYNENVHPDDTKRDIARHDTNMSIDTLISKSSVLLTEGGHFAVIAPDCRTQEIIYLLTLYHLDPQRVTIVKHNPSTPPKRVMIEAVKGLSQHYETSTLFVREKNYYTDDYRQLTDSFYFESTFKSEY